MNAMTQVPLRRSLPDWPRLMKVHMAAAYVGLSKNSLLRHGPSPKRVAGNVVWDRGDLDRWADAIAGVPLDAGQVESHSSDVERRWFEGRAKDQG
jgi:hypothetical protein